MEALIETLSEIGLTKGEAKVYISLLKVGESKVGPIIKASLISRSKVYDILERLKSKGIVSNVEKQGVMNYQALPPKTLLNLLKKKEEKLKEQEKLLKKTLPGLMSLQPKQELGVTIFEGFEGFKAMIDQTIQDLKPEDTYEAMGISKTTEGMRYYAGNIYKLQEKKKFKARSIFDKEGSFKIKERKNKNHKIRILPSKWHTPALFTIYGDTTGIHIGEEAENISLVIKNKKIAESFRVAFESMWKISRDI